VSGLLVGARAVSAITRVQCLAAVSRCKAIPKLRPEPLPTCSRRWSRAAFPARVASVTTRAGARNQRRVAALES
jgi:hypothetical protein